MDAQMKKGILELCLLQSISQKPAYGYDLLKQVTAAFSDVKESTVYAILRRMKSENYADTFIGEVSSGPERKYYRITPDGQVYLEKQRAMWESMSKGVHEFLK